jgi:GNAT superfamily N-acetyltransferase
MNPDVSIIRGIPHHASALTEITVAAKGHWGYPEKWMQLWLPTLTVTPEYISGHETWVAVMNDKPVAYYSFRHDGDGLWLDNLWVMPEYMGKGIGNALFNHALERSRSFNEPSLKIEADPHAAPFYEKMGARKVGELHSEVDGQPRTLPVMEMVL